jgi:hypothetical protein
MCRTNRLFEIIDPAAWADRNSTGTEERHGWLLNRFTIAGSGASLSRSVLL